MSKFFTGNKNFHIYSPKVPLNKWAKMRLTQTLVHTIDGSKYIYRIFLNGKEILQRDNTKPSDFYNVKVFVGDPWYPAQPGYVRNVKVRNIEG